MDIRSEIKIGKINPIGMDLDQIIGAINNKYKKKCVYFAHQSEEKYLLKARYISWSKDHKYYHLSIQKNLFGTLSLFKTWGSEDSNLGNFKIMFFETRQELEKEISIVHKKRLARGYELDCYK